MNEAERTAIHAAMVRLADGDRSAIDELVDRLWPVLLAFAKRSMHDDSAAEDVAQESFLKICSQISQLDHERDGLSWAFGIVHYEVLTQRRRKQRRREVPAGFSMPVSAVSNASQEEALLDREQALALEASLDELSDQDRLLLAGFVEAGVPGPTLRKRKQRALERLRAAWRRIYGEP